jgi:hypothetical protein
MEINKDILLECICYFYKYEFSDVTYYQVRKDLGNWYILATVVSDSDISEFYVGTKNVDIEINEYIDFVRCKKLSQISNKKLHK